MTAGLQALRALPIIELVLFFVVPAYWFGGLFLWLGWVAARGSMPRSERFEKMSRTRVVPRFLLEYGYMQLNWQTRVLIKLGFSANAITVLSLILATVGAYYLGIGRFFIGGWFMFLSFFCDAYDGLIARAMGTASVRGEYFDSFIDRYADIITSFGFLWYYKDDYLGASAVALGILGSAAMGYAKAKGEAVGVDPNVGIMQRHERGVWLGCFTTMAPLFAAFLEPDVAEKYFRGLGGHPRYHAAIFALAVVGVLSNVSAVWRAAYVMKRLPRPGAKTTMPATPPAPSQAIKETAQS